MSVFALSCDADPTPMKTGGQQLFGTDDPFDVAIAELSKDDQLAFVKGDTLFGLNLRDYDGLGPLYTRTACSDCHQEGTRGPGSVQKMVVVAPDGWTRADDQSKLPFGFTVHPLLTAGATTPIVPPAGDPSVKLTSRLGPPVLGRGFMEAVLDSEI